MQPFWFSPPPPETLQPGHGLLIPTPQLIHQDGYYGLLFYNGEPVFSTSDGAVLEKTRDKFSFVCPNKGGIYTYYINLGRAEVIFRGHASKYSRDESGAAHMVFEDGSQYVRHINPRGGWTERIDYQDGRAVVWCDGRLDVLSGGGGEGVE